MRAPIYIRVAMSIVSATALFAGLLLALIGLIFFGNFNFANNSHLGIFAATLFAPVFVAACWMFFLARPSSLSAALTFASYAVTAIAWFLWTIPAASGLVH
jgi:hypothetical protein